LHQAFHQQRFSFDLEVAPELLALAKKGAYRPSLHQAFQESNPSVDPFSFALFVAGRLVAAFVAAYLDSDFRATFALMPMESLVALVVCPSLEGVQTDFDEMIFRK
jgi:hypothetical protein